MKKSEEMKERIIRVTTELIEQGNGKVEEITTRIIADKANIGIGLIHYHFQSKERLVELCVQRMIGQVIAEFKPELAGELGGLERLKAAAKGVADFLAANPAISRISILADYDHPSLTDNTARTMMGFHKSLGSASRTTDVDDARFFALASVLQAAFLRKDLSRELFGYDFNDKRERDSFVEWLTDRLFKFQNV